MKETIQTININTALTQSQLMLWMGQQITPESPMYNMILTFDLKGSISITHFQLAFQALVNQSDILKTIFEIKNEEPQQKVLPVFPYEVEYLDWSKKDDVHIFYQNWLKKRTQISFDLSKCLFDCVLIKFSETHYIWYLNQHHLITDAWSVSVIYKEMARLYQLSIEGKLEEAQPIPSFKNYIDFEKANRLNAKQQTVHNYWQKKLDNCPPLPLLYQTKAEKPTSHSVRIPLDLGKERSKKLRALALERGIRTWTQHLSLYNIFATTLFAFLNRISGQQKLVIGSPSHNRSSAAFKDTIGIFIETYPLVASLTEEDSFSSLIKKVQGEVNGFLRYAQAGAASPDLSRSFNVFFNYINATFSDFNQIPMTSEWIHPNHCDPLHHLRLQVHDFDTSGSIQLYFDLNSEIFDKNQQTTVPQHFLALLDAFIANKEQPIAAVPLLSTKEYEKTIVEFNKNTYETTTDKNIIELVELQAAKTPFADSMVFQGTRFSYQTLNEKANQLAHYLLTQNVGVGHRVAICLKRSPEYVISVLAALKTGATFVPIPSTYPNERALYLIEDSQATLLISDSRLTACKNITTVPTLHINTFQNELANYQTHNLEQSISLDSTAFLIYTSGSTGNPKGVMIPNNALTSYIKWTKTVYVKQPAPAIPLFTTIGFDITANSVFLPLICGGTIHIYQEGNGNVDLSILEVMEDNQVDFVKLTPAHLAFLKGKKFENSRIKIMSVTGDEFKTELAHTIYNAFNGDITIYDEYGPSEATIGCIYHQYTPNITAPSMPIGKPIHNMNAYILDKYQNPVPQGVVGELYLGGIGLAAGYWGKPELTHQKFVDNPFEEGAKMYQTGDLARINKEGIIEFLGRIDFQVKINGYRIELGEIESSIVQYSTITGCVVVVLTDDQGLKHLAAYFTSSSLIMLSRLQTYLSQKLPRYMVPTHFRQLATFPLSPNGKVDRKALRKLEVIALNSRTEYVAPQTEIEEVMTEVWQGVLKLPKIGIHDTFLELGGNSLVAIQITARLNETFELEIPLTKIFELPTIHKISAYVEKVIIELLEAMEA